MKRTPNRSTAPVASTPPAAPPETMQQRLDSAGLGMWPEKPAELGKLTQRELFMLTVGLDHYDPVLSALQSLEDVLEALFRALRNDDGEELALPEDARERSFRRAITLASVAAELHKRQRAELDHAIKVHEFIASLSAMSQGQLLAARKRAAELNRNGRAPHLDAAVDAALDRIGSPLGPTGRATAYTNVARAADELGALAAAVRAGAKGAKGARAYARWKAANELLWTRGGAGSPRLREATSANDVLEPIFGKRAGAETKAAAKSVKGAA